MDEGLADNRTDVGVGSGDNDDRPGPVHSALVDSRSADADLQQSKQTRSRRRADIGYVSPHLTRFLAPVSRPKLVRSPLPHVVR